MHVRWVLWLSNGCLVILPPLVMFGTLLNEEEAVQRLNQISHGKALRAVANLRVKSWTKLTLAGVTTCTPSNAISSLASSILPVAFAAKLP